MINKLCFRIKKNGNPYCDCYCTKPPSQKGTHWYNNGIEDIRCIDCPDDFVPGRLHHK